MEERQGNEPLIEDVDEIVVAYYRLELEMRELVPFKDYCEAKQRAAPKREKCLN